MSAPPSPDAAASRADWLPLLAALASNLLLGVAVAATRYVIARTDFVTLAFLRYALAGLSLLPLVLLLRPRLPPARELAALGALGVLVFGLFPLSYNAALQYTLATRAAVAFALVPLLTLGMAAALRYEAFTLRKVAGGTLALAGVVLALGDPASVAAAPPTVLRGDLLMLLTVVLGSAYNVLSRRPLQRTDTLTAMVVFTATGATFLAGVLALRGGPVIAPGFSALDAAVVAYIALGGGSVGYGLFVWALKHTAPTRVAIFVPLSPIAASSVATWALGEPIGAGLVAGLALVTGGILLVNWGAFSRG